MTRIFYVVNVDWFFISHRLPLAKEALKKGYEVFVLTKDTGRRDEIEKLGIKFIDIEFERSGRNPLKEIALLWKLIKTYKKLKPNIVHHVTIKPSLYGTIALRMLGLEETKVINAISGLGYNFITGRSSIFQQLLSTIMNYSFSYHKCNFIFQNPDDLNFYDKKHFIKESNYIIIKGSGVDENKFKYTDPIKKEKLKVILSARILFDKGIIEFCEAAKILKKKWSKKAIFILIGDLDLKNLAGAKKEDVEKLLVPNYIEWMGFRKDIKEVLIESDIVCLPSYREGLPKSLVEAMAIGRPIITTDTPGCRECVIDGYNGYLVPVKDHTILSERIERLLIDEQLRIKMGKLSREIMVKEMCIKFVIQNTFNFYDRVQ